MYKKFLSAILIPLILLADSSEQESLLLTDDADLIAGAIDIALKKSGATNPVTDKFYNIPISNTFISTTSSTAGIELKQSGRYYLANSVSRIPASGKPVIKISGTDIVLDMNGFVIDGSLATSSHSDMIGIEIAASSRNVTIINGSLNTIKGMGIKVGAGADTITVKDVKITSCADSGIECAGTSGSKIKNLFLKNVQVSSGNGSQRDTSADAYGFRAEYVVSGSVENCSFQNMLPSTAAKDGIGVYLNACENLQCSGCSLNNNKAAATGVSSSGWGASDSGIVTDTNPLQWNGIYADSSGKIYVTGANSGSTTTYVNKYDTNGDLDTSYSDAVTFTTGLALVVDTSSRIYVAGQSFGSGFAFFRLNSSGTRDAWNALSSGYATSISLNSGQSSIYLAGYASGGHIEIYQNTSGFPSRLGFTTDAGINQWNDIYMDPSNNVYVAGQNTSNQGVVRKYDSSLVIVSGWGSSGSVTDTSVSTWNGIYVDTTTTNTYVAGQNTSSKGVVAKYTSSGALDTTWGDSNSGKITDTTIISWNDLKVDGADNTYVAGENTSNNGIIAKYDANGDLDTSWGSSGYATNTGVTRWIDIHLDGSGNVYVGGRNTSSQAVAAKYDTNGNLAATSTTYGAGKGAYLTGSTQGCKFSGCSVSNTSGNSVGSAYGLYLDSAKDCIFENCSTLSNSGGNGSSIAVGGFRLESASTNNQFVNCVSQGHTVSGTTSSVYGWQVSSNNNRFTNCVGSGIGSSSGGAAYGFYFSSTNNNNLLNCKAIGNQSSGATNCYGFYSTAGRSNMFNKCEGSSNTAVTGKCAGIALDAGEALSTISGGHFSGNQVTGAGSCYGIVLDPANASGVNRCSITNNTVSMNYATTNGATLAGLRDFTTDCNSLIAGNVLSLNGNARLNIGSAPNYNIDSADLTIDGSGNGGLNLYLTYDDGQNVADMVNETDVSNMQALSTSLKGWTNLLVVPQQE